MRKFLQNSKLLTFSHSMCSTETLIEDEEEGDFEERVQKASQLHATCLRRRESGDIWRPSVSRDGCEPRGPWARLLVESTDEVSFLTVGVKIKTFFLGDSNVIRSTPSADSPLGVVLHTHTHTHTHTPRVHETYFRHLFDTQFLITDCGLLSSWNWRKLSKSV